MSAILLFISNLLLLAALMVAIRQWRQRDNLGTWCAIALVLSLTTGRRIYALFDLLHGRRTYGTMEEWVECLTSLGVFLGILWLSHFFHSLRRAHESLQEQEAQFRQAILYAPYPIMIFTEDGEVSLVNRAWSEQTGYRLEDLPTLDAWRGKTCLIDEPCGEEIEIETKGGEKRIWETSLRPLGVSLNGRKSLIFMANDLTERKASDASRRRLASLIQQQAERMKAILASTTDMIFVFDRSGTCTFANHAGASLVGLSPGELAGKLLCSFADQSGVSDHFHPIIERVYAAGETARGMVTARDGAEERDFEYILTPMIDVEGSVDAVLATVRDVTERNRAAQERMRLKEEQIKALQEADRLKDEFLSIISHELRTPLNAITGFGSLLEDEVFGPLAPPQHDCLDKIHQGAQRMLELVNNLLDMARMQAGHFEIEKAPVHYPSLVERALTSLPLESGRVSLCLEVEPSVALDERRIFQVLVNLLSNANKFSPDAPIRVRAFLGGDRLVTEVEDSGIGIDPSCLPQLFSPFKQLDMSLTRRVGGSGLGLSICKGIVEAHGGSIEAASPGLGLGATFRFSLPLA